MTHEEYLNLHTQGEKELRAAYEALQKELGYSKMAADAEAKFADEYKDKFEAQKQRAYALALVINDLTRMVTYKGETKDEFIKRVKGILSVDPDLRVCELIEANAAQANRIAHLEYKIDELMLEWCPDEMTQEQLENYANHQRKASL